MKTRLLSLIAITVLAFSIGACRREMGLDYSKVEGQTGGNEQGQWRDLNGTLLTLESGKFTYTRGTAIPLKGTYTVASGTISMTSENGQTFAASWPNENSPVTLEGVALTKTD